MTVSDDLVQQFVALGMSQQKAIETQKNVNVTKYLTAAINECNGIELADGVGMLLYHLATKIKPQCLNHLPLLVKMIVAKKLDTTVRIDVALDHLLSHGATTTAVQSDEIFVAELEKVCGVGIVVTPEEIEKEVANVIAISKADIIAQRYRYNIFKIMQEVRTKLPWANGSNVKSEVEVQIFDLLGEKTPADLAPPPKVDKKKEKKTSAASKATKVSASEAAAASDTTDSLKDGANSIGELMKTKVHFHKPGENYKTDGYVVTEHTDRLIKEHLTITGGRVRTRFPPEPNGILHIGHAKAININFGYAAAHNGTCFLRYDDTNPEKEEEKFFIGIKDMVEWLGYTPDQITHSSDNFQQLYEWAVKLIQKGFAYVCHQSADDMKGFNAPPSPWRERPIEENLQLFEDMKNGKIDEGCATLRMKITLEEGKIDPVAYR